MNGGTVSALLDQSTTSAIASGFEPAAFLGHHHAQTLLPWLLTPTVENKAIRREVQLDDGDRLVLQDDCPASWQDGDPVLLLLHGLSGDHTSGYMIRMAQKAVARGIRAFRLDHRGSGAGRGLARHTYHAGRSEDVRAVLAEIAHVCNGSPVSIAGYSLSANLMLKLLGEDPRGVPECVHRVATVSPPIDLRACVDFMGKSLLGRVYDRSFTRWLLRQVQDSPQWRDDVPLARGVRKARRVVHFDEMYTAPAAGYRNVAHYYSEASAGPRIRHITTPTLILIAEDDPMVPIDGFRDLEIGPGVQLEVTTRGGHLGFYGRKNVDPDRYWADWRILEWLFD